MDAATCWWHQLEREALAPTLPEPDLPDPLPFEGVWGHDAYDIASTLVALRPHLKAGVSHWKLGSVCGAAADDVLRFVAGRASLTHEARKRLREWAGGEHG